MDRLFIFILTTFCGTFVGLHLSRKVQDRYIFLTEFSVMVFKMENLIRYNRYAIYEILERLKENKTGFISDEMIALSKSGKQIGALWKKEAGKIEFLTDDDKSVISTLGEQLGRSDTEGQIAAMESARQSLDTLIKDSDEIRKSKVRLYRSLGILLGAATGIIFL